MARPARAVWYEGGGGLHHRPGGAVIHPPSPPLPLSRRPQEESLTDGADLLRLAAGLDATPHFAAVDADGGVLVCGAGDDGRLGLGSDAAVRQFQRVDELAELVRGRSGAQGPGR